MSTVFDDHANLAYALVTVAPAPALSGVTLTVDDASSFPTEPFNAIVWPPSECAFLSNAEIVRVTGIAGNVFTIDRAEEGTTAKPIAVGWQIANSITVKVIDDIQNAVNQIETDAVILNPLTSVRNRINPAADVIPLSIFGSVGQTEDLFAVGVEPDVAGFRLSPRNSAVGIGAGTFDPSAYGFYEGSTLIVSQAEDGEYDANGGPNIVPSGDGYVQTFFDANFVPAVDSPVASLYQYGSSARYSGDKLVQIIFGQYQEVLFRGMKPSGSGNQIQQIYGMTAVASIDAVSTGDVETIYGTNSGAYALGSGEIGTGVFGTYSFAQLGTGGPKVPTAEGVTGGIYSDGRDAVQGVGVHVTEPVGGANFDHTYGLLLDGPGASADAWAIYSAGGKSALLAGAVDVVPLALIGAAGQTADLLDISIDPDIPFLRVVPGGGGAVGIGAGTFDPSAYGGYDTTFVISRATDGWYEPGANGGPNIDPGAGGASQVFFDANYVASVDQPGITVFGLGGSARIGGANDIGSMQTIYYEAVFRGTKAAGSGTQTGSLSGAGFVGITQSDSTGDVDYIYGLNVNAFGYGSGHWVYGVYGEEIYTSIGTNNGPQAPEVHGFRTYVESLGRPVAEGVHYKILSWGGGANFDHTYGIYIESMISGSADAWSIYSAGGKSRLDAGAATVTPLTLRGFAAQSANLFVTEDSAGNDLVAISAAGAILFGTSADTNLYRDSASVLKTDDSLIVALDLTVLGKTSVDEVAIDTVPDANSTVTGLTLSFTAGEALAFGDPVYVKNDGKVWKADANTVGTYPSIGIAAAAVSANATVSVSVHGVARLDSWTWTVGGIVYLSTTAGLTQTQPSATNDAIQIIGVATSATTLYVAPDLFWITHV